MYHEITDRQVAQRRKKHVVILGCIIALILACWVLFGAVQAHTRAQGAVALRDSILNSAKQCCAIEGSYPSTLSHLEEDYGLVINKNDYIVSYECFAGNIVPSVVVTPR